MRLPSQGQSGASKGQTRYSNAIDDPEESHDLADSALKVLIADEEESVKSSMTDICRAAD